MRHRGWIAAFGLAGMLIAWGSVVRAWGAVEGGYEMTTYYVAFLKRGPAWTPEETEATRTLQEAHLAYIESMAASGDLILAGPFLDEGDLRGMFVFAVASMDRARELANGDPAVKAGRLVLEFHPWYSARGIRIDQGTTAR